MSLPRQGPTPVGQRNRASTIPSRRSSGPLPEEWTWDETPDGDQDSTLDGEDLWFELRGDR